eukprot:TRINITY_DN23172_c0_g1_i1.p1 TRINITY_DN23172_c0_g1~~TRINITY_DN23172_c0_g1_i1.p1  ORF type:complete len:503 (+),score=58.90 TRINITY_DN23172_c0_g1_i1:112-1620(+)
MCGLAPAELMTTSNWQVWRFDDFVGEWSDQFGQHVLVDNWNDYSVGVTITLRKGAERCLRVKKYHGGFKCGSYVLDIENSNSTRIVWCDAQQRRYEWTPWKQRRVESWNATGPELVHHMPARLLRVQSATDSEKPIDVTAPLLSVSRCAKWPSASGLRQAPVPAVVQAPPLLAGAAGQVAIISASSVSCCGEGQWCTCRVPCYHVECGPPPLETDPAMPPLCEAVPCLAVIGSHCTIGGNASADNHNGLDVVGGGTSGGGWGYTDSKRQDEKSDGVQYRRHRLEQISRTLSSVLRHETKVPARSDGYCRLRDVLGLRRFQRLHCTEQDVFHVVEGVQECGNSKRRFDIIEGDEGDGLLIRANQGFSRKDILAEKAYRRLWSSDIDLPEPCVHGTYMRNWDSISRKGLLAGGLERWRNEAHFACEDPLGTGPRAVSGMRECCEVAIWLDLRGALQDGLPFFVSSNGVILSPGNADGVISTKYFKKVVNLCCRPPRLLFAAQAA